MMWAVGIIVAMLLVYWATGANALTEDPAAHKDQGHGGHGGGHH